MDNQLQHYGVLGMKWGVRKTRKWATSKTQPSSARSSVLAGVYAATGSKKVGKALDKSNDIDAKDWKRAKTEYKKSQQKAASKKTKTKSTDTKTENKPMTNEELKEKINRLELEKRYRELSTAVNPPKNKRGKDFALRVVEKIGENTLTNLGTQAANHFLGEAINKAFKVDSSDAVKRVVNPQKGQTDKK